MLEPIFGTSAAVGLVIAIVAIEVNAIGIPVGLCLLNAGQAARAAALNGGKKPNPWVPVINALKQPVAWAPILAVILVLCGVKWPAYLDPSFTLLAGANASVAVFAAGITLSSVKIVFNGQVFMGSFLKLIVMRLSLLWVSFHMDPSTPQDACCLRRTSARLLGHHHRQPLQYLVATGTSSLAVSTLLFMGTCPLWIWLTDLSLKLFA